jgi:uncharacterized protein (TIGR00369 family)
VEELSSVARRALEAQSFSALVGARLVCFSEGEAVLELPVRKELLQQNGFVHGGVLSYAADNALTFAEGSVLGPAVLTSEYKINSLRPATGETLMARASEGNPARTLRLFCVVHRPPEGLPAGRAGERRAPEVAWRVTNRPSAGHRGS